MLLRSMQVLTLQKLPIPKQRRALADEHDVEYEERHKKGDILNLFFEEFCRRASDPARIRHGSSGRDFTSDQEKAGKA